MCVGKIYKKATCLYSRKRSDLWYSFGYFKFIFGHAYLPISRIRCTYVQVQPQQDFHPCCHVFFFSCLPNDLILNVFNIYILYDNGFSIGRVLASAQYCCRDLILMPALHVYAGKVRHYTPNNVGSICLSV